MFRILIVEDDRRLQEAISDYLLAKGLEIVAVSDGLQAMEQMESNTRASQLIAKAEILYDNTIIPNLKKQNGGGRWFGRSCV